MNTSRVTPIPSIVIKKPRIEYIDLLKAFGIFCLLWFHSIGDLRTSNDEWLLVADPVFKFIVTFNMPLFFMISGFLFAPSLNLNFKDFLKKKSAALLIPHVIWSLLIALMNYGMTFLGWRAGAPEPELAESFRVLSRIRAFFIPDPRADLWFFKDLFLSSLIVFVSCKLFKKRYVAFIASMIFVLIFDVFGLVGKMQRFLMPIFWTGILLKHYYPFVCRHINEVLTASGIVFAVCVYFFDFTYMIYISDFPPLINFPQSLLSKKIVFDVTDIDVSGFRLLTAVAGSIFFFTLFQRFWKKNKVTSLLSRCGQITLGVYGIQAIVLQGVMRNVLDFTDVNIWIYRFVITPVSAALVLAGCILTISLVQRNKSLTFILFGSSLVERGVIRSDNKDAQVQDAWTAEALAAEARRVEACAAEALALEALALEALASAARVAEARAAEARTAAARAAEARVAETQALEARTAAARTAEAYALEARALEAQALEARTAEARALDTLAAEVLAAGARAATRKTKTPAATKVTS
ncbi:MAG: acyltransferase [Treponema sp.]|nr:acyltransferase [Treponema sp.]